MNNILNSISIIVLAVGIIITSFSIRFIQKQVAEIQKQITCLNHDMVYVGDTWCAERIQK